jgi:hypothetical protein
LRRRELGVAGSRHGFMGKALSVARRSIRLVAGSNKAYPTDTT